MICTSQEREDGRMEGGGGGGGGPAGWWSMLQTEVVLVTPAGNMSPQNAQYAKWLVLEWGPTALCHEY